MSTNDAVARLERLRDEIRLNLHLAGMDAKDRLREAEPSIAHAEKLAQEIVETATEALTEIAQKVRAFKEHQRARH